MVPAYNKVTKIWLSTEDGSELTPPADWMIDPIFADEVMAHLTGQRFWTFDGNTINNPTLEEYNAVLKAEHQVEQWRVIQAERDTRRAGGVNVGGNWFHSDDTSRIQFLGLLMYGANMPPGIMWKTMSGTFVEMTSTLAQQIFGTIGAKDAAIFTAAETHRAHMLASATPETYNHKSGAPAWPVVYGE